LLTDDLMPQFLQEAGYETNPTKTTYEETDEAKSFAKRRSDLLTQQAEGTGAQYWGGKSFEQHLAALNAAEEKFQSTWQPITDYNLRKLDPPEVEAARTKYGATSEQYLNLKQQYDTQAIADDKQQRQLTSLYMEKTRKFLAGDIAVTPEQQTQIAELYAPVLAAADALFTESTTAAERTAGETKAEVEATQGNLLDTVSKTFATFNERVKETGMNMLQGLEATGAQIKQTGADMTTALAKTVGVYKELLDLGIKDFTGEVTKKVAMGAAAIGRDPGDPGYGAEIQELIAKQVKEGTLNLAAMEAQGQLAITERTGGGLEEIQRGKTAVAERTGGQLEQSALQEGSQTAAIQERTGSAKEGIAARLGAAREGLVSSRGMARSAIAEQQAALRYQLGAGLAPTQVGLGQATNQYQEALAQQRLANTQAAMGVPGGFVDYYAANRRAQPTATQTTSQSTFGGVVSGLAGLGSAAASIYSGAASASLMRGMAGKLANQGGGGTYGFNLWS